MNATIQIRPYGPADRAAVRRISCETAFLGKPHQEIFPDEEILADALTLYFTDHEPYSCFVAVAEQGVIGYIIGSRDVPAMQRVMNKNIIPGMLWKALRRGAFFNRYILKFLGHIMVSLWRGEFILPDCSRQYPATLHINIQQNFRGHNLGSRLITRYLEYLQSNHINGVHLASFSDSAKEFFLKNGFEKLHEKERTYLKSYVGRVLTLTIFGKK
jgi:hypothetical protein